MLKVFSLMASGFASSSLVTFLGLAALVDGFRFGGGWCHDFSAAGLLVSSLVGGGFGGSEF